MNELTNLINLMTTLQDADMSGSGGLFAFILLMISGVLFAIGVHADDISWFFEKRRQEKYRKSAEYKAWINSSYDNYPTVKH